MAPARRWTAILAAVVLAFATSLAAAGRATPVPVDAFGNPLCVQDQGGDKPEMPGHSTLCCIAACQILKHASAGVPVPNLDLPTWRILPVRLAEFREVAPAPPCPFPSLPRAPPTFRTA